MEESNITEATVTCMTSHEPQLHTREPGIFLRSPHQSFAFRLSPKWLAYLSSETFNQKGDCLNIVSVLVALTDGEPSNDLLKRHRKCAPIISHALSSLHRTWTLCILVHFSLAIVVRFCCSSMGATAAGGSDPFNFDLQPVGQLDPDLLGQHSRGSLRERPIEGCLLHHLTTNSRVVDAVKQALQDQGKG